MKLEFRDLYADEIELRVGTVVNNERTKGFTLLLYKNARVDMALLDEVVGVGNWQREHKILGNDIYCKVGIYNDERKEWIWREDAGAEANTEIEKSKASDSFKRACVNFGLGRCLYSAPFVWINSTEENTPKARYSVKVIDYKDHKITRLTIINDKTKEVVFQYGKDTKVVENGENAPKNDIPKVEEPKGSITKHDLTLIQSYVSALPSDSAKDNFYNWVEKHFKTMTLETLTTSQGKAIVNKLGLE